MMEVWLTLEKLEDEEMVYCSLCGSHISQYGGRDIDPTKGINAILLSMLIMLAKEEGLYPEGYVIDTKHLDVFKAVAKNQINDGDGMRKKLLDDICELLEVYILASALLGEIM